MKKLTLREEGRKLGVSHETIRNWRKYGKPKLKVVKNGKVVRMNIFKCARCSGKYSYNGGKRKYCSDVCRADAHRERHYYDGKIMKIGERRFKLIEIK